MITCSPSSGIAVDAAELWKGTLSEPAEDGAEIVITMQIEDDCETLILEWNEGVANSKLYVPIERLKKILAEV